MPLDGVLDTHPKIAAAVLLFADPDPNTCVRDPQRSQELNVASAQRAIDALAARSIPILFTSTEFLYDGRKGKYTEEDPPSPILTYGRQKLLIETHLKKLPSPTVIVRLAKVYGSEPGDDTIFTGWLEQIVKGDRHIRCASDQYFSPIHVDDVARALLLLIDQHRSGTFQLGGPERHSRSALLHMLVKELRARGAPAISVEECSIHSFALPEPRPLDVSLDSSRTYSATGFTPAPPRVWCRRIVDGYASRFSW